MIERSDRLCRHCQRVTVHDKQVMEPAFGCVATVVTLGLFLPVWFCMIFGQRLFQSWRCTNCGSPQR